MKQTLLDHCIDKEEARLYDFVNSCKVTVRTDITTLCISKNGNLGINEEFYNKEKDHIIGCLLHEALHIHLGHFEKDRRLYEFPVIANIAQDIFINDKIEKIKYSLPECACTYESCDVPRRLTTSDEIYNYLLDNIEKISASAMTLSKEELDALGEEEQEEGVSGQGDEPTTIEKIACSIFKSTDYRIYKINEANQKVSVRERDFLLRSLENTLGSFLKPEILRTFSRQRRGGQIEGILLPAQRALVRRPTLSIYLDVSGSMQGSNIEKSLSLLKDLKTMLNEYQRKYFTFSTSCEYIDSGSFDEVEVGGGTVFNSFHDFDNSDVVIIITDCEFSFDFLEKHKRKKVIVITLVDTKGVPDTCERYTVDS